MQSIACALQLNAGGAVRLVAVDKLRNQSNSLFKRHCKSLWNTSQLCGSAPFTSSFINPALRIINNSTIKKLTKNVPFIEQMKSNLRAQYLLSEKVPDCVFLSTPDKQQYNLVDLLERSKVIEDRLVKFAGDTDPFDVARPCGEYF
eukprot:GHVR01020433.1.p1 GENE.GHVR01020433.1~~GHVR01020433.1.p1  ORF type:complete len:146 (+),score=22.03 GHVR01020433.1:78-515(+)